MPYRSFNSFWFDLIKSELFSCTFRCASFAGSFIFVCAFRGKDGKAEFEKNFVLWSNCPTVHGCLFNCIFLKIIWKTAQIFNLTALYRISSWLIKEIDDMYTYMCNRTPGYVRCNLSSMIIHLNIMKEFYLILSETERKI